MGRSSFRRTDRTGRYDLMKAHARMSTATLGVIREHVSPSGEVAMATSSAATLDRDNNQAHCSYTPPVQLLNHSQMNVETAKQGPNPVRCKTVPLKFPARAKKYQVTQDVVTSSQSNGTTTKPTAYVQPRKDTCTTVNIQFRDAPNKVVKIQATQRSSVSKMKAPFKIAFELVRKKLASVVNPHVHAHTMSADEKFYVTLLEESELMEDTYTLLSARVCNTSKHSQSMMCLHSDYPVLKICYGFKTKELISEGKHTLPVMEEHCVNRVRDGIDRVLFGNTDSEPDFHGIPMSTWFKMLEPAFDVLTSKAKPTRRHNKGPLTKRRKRLRLRPGYTRFPLTGDSVLMHNVWGPLEVPRHNRVFQIFATRFGELGERNRRARHIRLADPYLPNLDTTNRGYNRSRTVFTRASPDARRHGSNTRQNEQLEDVQPQMNPVIPLDPERLQAILNIDEIIRGRHNIVHIDRLVFH